MIAVITRSPKEPMWRVVRLGSGRIVMSGPSTLWVGLCCGDRRSAHRAKLTGLL
jgi:hypothetical protein